jgi:hypothetical protein
LNNLLDLIVESRLGPDVVESLNKLFHHFATVLFIFGTEHAHQVHDAFYKTSVVEVKIFYQTLEDILVRVKKGVAVLLEELCVPLNDRFLCLT